MRDRRTFRCRKRVVQFSVAKWNRSAIENGLPIEARVGNPNVEAPTNAHHKGVDTFRTIASHQDFRDYASARLRSKLASPPRRAEYSIINANTPVNNKSLTSVLRKKNSVGGNSGRPTVSACHQPAAVKA